MYYRRIGINKFPSRDELEGMFDMYVNGMYNPINLSITKDGEDSIVLKAVVPGVKKEDIKIAYSNGTVTVTGKGQEIGEFSVSTAVGVDLLLEGSKASLEYGILTITIPKKNPEVTEIKL